METTRETLATTLAKRAARQAGMTMLEILIVLAIIALVMGFLFGPRILEMFGEAKEETAGLQVNKYANDAYAQWMLSNKGKSCPESLNELAKYTNNDETKDPWDNELIMVCGESAPEGVNFGVQSKGPDGKQDTGDDIKSWEKKKKK
jgi:prepilin-type N-terminal cleavage/methylation domain-containing protein